MARCVPVVLDEGTAKNGPQAAAICNSMWRDHVNKKSAAAKVGARHSKTDQEHIQGIHDSAVACGADCAPEAQSKSAIKAMQDMGAVAYAVHEGWDIQQCCAVISQLASMCQDECAEGEMDEAMALCKVTMELIKHCEGECQEMMDAIMIAPTETAPAMLSLNYVRSLHLPHDEQWLRDVVAVKSVGQDGIHGYTMLWGDPKLTDVEAEFFLPKTDFWDAVIGKSAKPLTWDHALDPALKSSPIVGEILEWGDDDIGRWYNAQLKRAHAYRKAIDKLISGRNVGTSSDSVQQYVIREKAGKAVWLKQWPWFGSALTTTPAEPRMLDVGSPYWKSIGIDPARARTGASGLDRPGVGIPEDLLIQAQLVKRAAGVTWTK